MHTRYPISTGLLITMVLAGFAAGVRAQQPRLAIGVPGSRPMEVPEPENRAVQAILESKPGTPAELIRAAGQLATFNRPDLAKDFLKIVLAAKLDREQLIALHDRFGSGLFLKMSAREELAPEAVQLKEAVLSAVDSRLKDPQYLAGLIDRLVDPSANARYRAMDGLRRARSAAVGPMLKVLADPAQKAKHANVRAALVRIGADAVAPLEAVLESPDAKLQIEAIRLLADLNARATRLLLLAALASSERSAEVRVAAQQAYGRLIGPPPQKGEAARMLEQEAERYATGSQPLKADEEGWVELWRWDQAKQEPVPGRYPVDDARRFLASRLARAAYSVDPEDREIRLLHLATLLERARYENGLDKPLPTGPGTAAEYAAGTEFGPGVIEEVLRYAMEQGHAGAATAAARILGRIGTAGELLQQGVEPAPLVRAARHADRRLRFAALEAILNLEPAGPFPGSSYVSDALAFFTASRGTPRALVAGPVTAETWRVAGYLAAMGYQTETAVIVREMLEKALSSPDYELALVDAALGYPTPDLLIQQLHHDCHTARLPVGIVARSGQLERAEQMARRDRLAAAFVRPHTADTVQWQVEQLSALVGQGAVARDERLAQAAQALQWLEELSREESKVFNLHRAEVAAIGALYVPELGQQASVVVAGMGTAESQTALVDLASRWTQPIELRRVAAKAFRQSIEEHGILLTSRQLLAQYDRYNDSETLDVPTQRILGFLLNCIETPTRPVNRQGAAPAAAEEKAEDGNPR